MRTQCLRAEEIFFDDFRVLGFLSAELPESKAKVLEEKARALPDVSEVRYISRESALDQMKAQDPEMVKSVALLGDNPLHPILELRPTSDSLGRWPLFIEQVSKLPDMADVRYKATEFNVILQLQFYRHLLELVLSLGVFVWCFGAAAGLWLLISQRELRQSLEGIGWKSLFSALGTAAGAGLVYAAAQPLKNAGRWWVWPDFSMHSFLILSGMLGALWFDRETEPSRRPSTHKTRTPEHKAGGDKSPSEAGGESGPVAGKDVERVFLSGTMVPEFPEETAAKTQEERPAAGEDGEMETDEVLPSTNETAGTAGEAPPATAGRIEEAGTARKELPIGFPEESSVLPVPGPSDMTGGLTDSPAGKIPVPDDAPALPAPGPADMTAGLSEGEEKSPVVNEENATEDDLIE